MAKRRLIIDDGPENEEIVVGKKARKRQGKAKAAAVKSKERRPPKKSQAAPAAAPAEDPMSQCAILCQEQRWREALLLVRRVQLKAERDGKQEVAAGLDAAAKKIEYSLRRQMATAVIHAARGLLNKEYLLDVG